jgi:phospholipid/cholesterol/gamma-HCH transport system ATP-binding protein
LTSRPVLTLIGARGDDVEYLPRAPLNFTLSDGDFALIETSGTRQGTAFADLCMGLMPLAAGHVNFLGRDWSITPPDHADALRGHIGRLFYKPLRADIPDVAARVLLSRLHHTRMPEADLRAEAVSLAMRFGLPGLPSGPARMFSELDLLRAACVRAFLGGPRLIILELPLAVQQDDLLSALLEVGAEARGNNASVMWLATSGPALRDRSIRPTWRLRMSDAGLVAARQAAVG